MQEDNRFFRGLWRFNAIVLALAGIAVLILCTAALYHAFFHPRFNYGPAPQGHFAPVPKDAEKDYTYRLEPTYPDVSLQNEQIFSLRRWKGAPMRYGLSLEMRMNIQSFRSQQIAYTDSVNLLAIDMVSGNSHWLFDGYQRAILSQTAIYADLPITPNQIPNSKAIATVICTVDSDSNNDGVLDGNDRQSLYLYKPGNSQPSKLLDADYILSYQQISNGNYLVVYESGKSAFAATYNVPDFKLRSKRELPNVPK